MTTPSVSSFRWAFLVLLGLLAFSPARAIAGMSPEEVKKFNDCKAKAEKGDANAQNILAGYYLYSEGVAGDMAQAVFWWRKGAELGDAGAICNLGIFYFHIKNKNVSDRTEADVAQAVLWWRKGAELGYSCSQTNLARCYHYGNGVAKDMVQAVSWYRKAAEQGDEDGQHEIASCYVRGEGVAKDMAQAVYWFLKAAEQGYGYAQYDLAGCYASGEGVAKDEVEAYAYYNLAGAKDIWRSRDAREKVAELEKKLSREEIATGQKRARELQKRIDEKEAAKMAAKKAGK